MVRPYSLLTLALAGSLMLLFTTCKEDLSVDNSDKNFPITLRYEQDGDAIHFSWDAAKVSSFEKYVLIRSANPIPPGLFPNVGGLDNIFTSDRADSTTFTDFSPPLFQEVHYKLYVDIGDRFVESDDVAFSFDNLLINGNAAFVRFVPDSNWVVIGDDNNGRVLVVDYLHKTVFPSRPSMPFTSLDNMAVTVGYYNGAPALFWWSGFSSPFVMSLPDLGTLKSYGASVAPFSWIVSPNGRYFTTQYDFDNGFTTRQSDDFSLVKGYYRPNYYEHRTLLLLDPVENLLVEASPYQLRSFKVDATEGTVTDIAQKGTSNFSTFLQYLPASHDGQYFIPQYDGIVYDRNLNFVAQVPIAMTAGIVDCAFSQNGQYLYALSNDFQAFGSILTKYNFPAMTVAAERRLLGVQARDIEATPDGDLVFVGSNVNGTNNMFIKQLHF